jgi:eukaryotic-like serine/threonine-protein kinase
MNDEDLFHLALEMPIGERSTFLDQACSGDVDRRRRVELLLRSHETPDSFLAGPLVNPRAIADLDLGLTADVEPGTPEERITGARPPAEGTGSQIGPYKLLQPLGEGGMGTVYLAEQTQPIRRKVALKITKPGMDSRQVIARFEAERQALALMDHVNIARVFDAGATQAGRPYFVMELVHGVPITQYCDDNHLSPRQRLELFAPVCQAIQHAHQKGIIHRDIKPSNVMVTLYDGKPVPKVIDFGVAKATEQKLTERTLFTQYGALVGTLEYMSPEQAETSAFGIDTRSDIYSLGVLLYELLTGSTPLTHQRMKQAAFGEILRLIKEEEPPTPSARLSESGEMLASISAQRRMEPAKLTKLVRGELDWIVMKTLEKDRNHRYETASGLAADLQRYLDDDPVQACPPSAGYRFRKFARRNKGALAVAGLVFLFLTLAGGAAGWVLRDRSIRVATMSRQVVQALEESEQLYRQGMLPEAVQAAHKARGLLQAGGAGNELQRRVRDRLTDLAMVGMLDDARLRGSEVNEASRFDVGATANSYAEAFREYGIAVETLESVEAAKRIGERIIREDLTAALDYWSSLPVVDPKLKSRLIAIAMAADADEWRRHVRAASQADLRSLKTLADSQEALKQRPSTLNLLGHSLYRLGDLEATVNLLQKAQRRYPSDFWINESLGAYLTHEKRLRLNEALRYLTAAVALRPQSPGAHFKLGLALARNGASEEAVAAFQEAIRLKPGFIEAHLQLGQHRVAVAKDFEGAIVEFSNVIELDPMSVKAWTGRGLAHLRLCRYDSALADFSTAVRVNPTAPMGWLGRGDLYVELEQWSKAAADFSKAIEAKPDLIVGWVRRGNAYLKLDKRDKAVADFSRAIELGPNIWPIRSARADAYRGLNQWEDALADFSKLIELQPTIATFRLSRGQTYRQMSQWDNAVSDFSKAIEMAPDEGQAWNERGWSYAELSRWREAAADFTKLVALEPGTAAYWDYSAVAQLAAHDARAYRAACAGMMVRFESTQDPATASRMVATLVAAPNPVAKHERVVPLAEIAAAENREWNAGLLGAAYYRADKADAALECFERKAKELPLGAGDLLFMAMAHHRLGHADEARARLAEADQWIAAAGRSRASAVRRPGPTWDNWREEIAALILRGEAASLIRVADTKLQ